VEHIAIYAHQDTMTTVGRLVTSAEAWKADVVAVDVIGMGRGVADRLKEVRKEQGLPWTLVEVDVSRQAPPHRRGEPRPKRLRDYLWLEVAKWLREESPVFAWRTPDERQHAEDLVGELSSVAYALDSHGLIVVESKDEMRKRLGHSPDLGDALCISFGDARPWAGRVVIL
jgi:hypothetical protein